MDQVLSAAPRPQMYADEAGARISLRINYDMILLEIVSHIPEPYKSLTMDSSPCIVKYLLEGARLLKWNGGDTCISGPASRRAFLDLATDEDVDSTGSCRYHCSSPVLSRLSWGKFM